MQRSRIRKLTRNQVTSTATRRVLCRAPVAAAIFAAIHSAHAQQVADEAEVAPAGGLQEVIVTAQKRVENAQDVPITVTALDTRALEQLNVQNFNDYAQALPQLAYQTSAPGFSQIHMRGISSDNNPNHSGPLPTVGMYLDEQPITTIQGPLDLHVYDIARVEVLTGPQGTLYGASSEAGTVKLVTNKPEIGRFKAGYDVQGNDQSHGGAGGIAEGFVNVPINDMMALRLVGWAEHDSGYIDNVKGTLTYPSSGFTLDNATIARNHYNSVDTSGGRAQLRIDIADSWTITPQLMAQKSRWGGIFAQEDLGPVGLAAEGNVPIPDLSVRHFYPEGGDDAWTDAALTVEGKVGNFDVTYAGAFLKRDDHTPSDYSDYSLGYNAYASYWPPNSTQRILGMDHYQMWSNELRVSTPKDLPVRAVVGGFAQRQTHDISQQYIITGLNPTYWVGYGTANPVPDTWWWTDEQRVNRDYALFTEATWDILKNLSITGGERRFRYDNTLTGFYGFGLGTNLSGYSSTGQDNCTVFVPFRGAPCYDLVDANGGPKRSEGDGWTPKVSLAWKIDEFRMVYITYSEGFRPGGINRIGSLAPYTADFLKNYEIGWKTTWFDNHLRFNGAVFMENWDNFQFSFLGPNSVTVVANSPSARANGFETEFEWAAAQGLVISGGAAYTNAYLTQYYCGAADLLNKPVTTCPSAADPNPPQAPEGQQLPSTPRLKADLTARYSFPLPNASWQGFVQGQTSYQTQVWADLRTVERSILGPQPAYALTNLSAGIEQGKWSIELLVKNAFDRRASQYRYTECTEATCGPVAVYDVIARPRLIGLQWSQRFD